MDLKITSRSSVRSSELDVSSDRQYSGLLRRPVRLNTCVCCPSFTSVSAASGSDSCFLLCHVSARVSASRPSRQERGWPLRPCLRTRTPASSAASARDTTSSASISSGSPTSCSACMATCVDSAPRALSTARACTTTSAMPAAVRSDGTDARASDGAVASSASGVGAVAGGAPESGAAAARRRRKALAAAEAAAWSAMEGVGVLFSSSSSCVGVVDGAGADTRVGAVAAAASSATALGAAPPSSLASPAPALPTSAALTTGPAVGPAAGPGYASAAPAPAAAVAAAVVAVAVAVAVAFDASKSSSVFTTDGRNPRKATCVRTASIQRCCSTEECVSKMRSLPAPA
mmetsp:Transcript_28140/g.90926  ORF Transcript_28140/g.90926 Transcript_28140/m.90926 type:complete len:345 (+) Transcript_28140:513-1547(+)